MARHRKLIQKVRRRRSPELARQELLDAAERLFRDLPPDQVGLKDIGREADVSHALITHYFGTYHGIVEAVFERRTRALRERVLDRLAQGGIKDAEELIDMLFSAFDDPVLLRLMMWFGASEGRNAAQARARRGGGRARGAARGARAREPGAAA